MDVTTEDFRRFYESLSNEALLEVDAGELVPVAKACLAEEVAKRGLHAGAGEAAEAVAATEADAAVEEPAEELVSIAEYDYPDEADLAKGLLEGAGIPATVDHEPGIWKLMVPTGMSEQALQMLVSPMTDEELTAQAEAAGVEDGEG
jgi:hypothetical protein